MKNYVQPGDVLDLTVPYAVSSGDGVLVGSIFGVATADALISTEVPVAVRGVFDVTCLGTDTPAQGALLYWDDTNKRLTTTASGNTLVGKAVVAKSSGPTVVRIKLDE